MAEAADFHGTRPSPARRWMRRTGVLLGGAPLLAGLLQLLTSVPAGASTPQTPQAPTEAGTVSVSVDSVTPGAPTGGDTVTVTGTVTNKGKQNVTDAHVALRVGSLLNTLSGIDAVARNSDDLRNAVGPEIDSKYSEKFSELTPGVSQSFTLSVPVNELNLGEDGVYELAVALAGETSTQPWEQTLGVQRTFLPWKPEGDGTKTKTTFMWPLISTVHMTAETGSDEQQTPVFHDDTLAKEIAPGGRLDRMVALGRDLDITWVIDPDLLASVEAMTDRYEVPGEGDENVVGDHQSVAKRWLTEVQKAVADKEVVALPFGDPDVASLAHNGTSVTGSLSHLKEATDVASGTVESILHVKPTTDFAWPVNGVLDPSVVRVATSAGADKVIARSDSFEEAGLTYTTSAPRPIGGGTTAVVADSRLSTVFQGDMTDASTSTLAVQRFLAQSLTLGLQTDRQRSVVVAPQRTPSASQAQTMAEAIEMLQDSTWSRSQDLTDAAASKPDPAATTKVPPASSYPSALRKQELPMSTFEQIARTGAKLDKFKVILSNQSRVVTPFGRALNRSMSVSWRGRQPEAAIHRSGIEVYLDGLIGQVRLIDKSETKLSGRSATIPVTVQNNLVQGVEHLVLRLTSTNPTRLEIGGASYEEQPVSVSGGHSQSVKFTTSANANGRATVVAQLYTQDGQKYGAPVTFDVRVTEITATVMLVIGGGVLLLVLAGFRMYTQRKRAAVREAGEQQPEQGAGDDDGPQNPGASAERLPQESAEGPWVDDPEQPSDPAPDTAPESADPSGTGERVDR